MNLPPQSDATLFARAELRIRDIVSSYSTVRSSQASMPKQTPRGR